MAIASPAPGRPEGEGDGDGDRASRAAGGTWSAWPLLDTYATAPNLTRLFLVGGEGAQLHRQGLRRFA
jgi:hypothetical protein